LDEKLLSEDDPTKSSLLEKEHAAPNASGKASQFEKGDKSSGVET